MQNPSTGFTNPNPEITETSNAHQWFKCFASILPCNAIVLVIFKKLMLETPKYFSSSREAEIETWLWCCLPLDTAGLE